MSFRSIFLSLLAFLGGASTAFGQKEALYAQYLINPLAINPAYAGSRETLNMTLMFRRRWFNTQSVPTPTSQSLGIDGAVANGKIGLGLLALNDRVSPYGTTGVFGSVAYRVDLPALAKLSIGVQGGVNVLPVFDPTSGISSFNRAISSYGVGVYYQSDRFFGGISLPELATQKFLLAGQYLRPLFIQAGTKLNLSDNAVLVPSILVTQTAGHPIGLDLNARLWLKEKLGLGLSLRETSLPYSTNYVQALAEYQLSNTIRVGYIFNSQTPEAPYYPVKSLHEFVFRFAPNNLKFSY